MSLVVRPARPEDRDFVVATAAELVTFGPPEWRTAEEIVEGEARTLRAFFAGASPGSALLVAEEGGRPLGFAYLETLRDYFLEEEHGHIGILAVTGEAQGRGAGGALLEAAEAWAMSRGFRRLTLHVFERNARARAVYDRRGYRPESLKYVKLLGEPET
ncbi:MAG TPA: GNAT family N-acetyltransferase [Thermoanaerobaculia bacterium]|nr:GNAT family N-acetyltransferase [Thermoanaerobaculia bacterium]